jgi:hypothetical protein
MIPPRRVYVLALLPLAIMLIAAIVLAVASLNGVHQ